MAEAQIHVQAAAVVEVHVEGQAPVEVLASPAAVVEIMTEGVQGPQGLTGDINTDLVAHYILAKS